MERLPMCRVCLAENVRMYIVTNRNLHELYEKLTDVPFVTEDSRPILACFFCYAKIKQCYRLLQQCLEAEELFAQRMYEDYEPNPLSNQDRLQLFSGFIKSPIEQINIVDECQTERIAVKEEISPVCDGLEVIIEPKKEYQKDELELENLDNSCLDVADIPPHHSESDLEEDVPLMQLKTEVEDEEVSKKKPRATDTRRATVAEKPKLDTRGTKLENAITAEQTKQEKSDSKINRMKKSTSKPGTYFKEPYKCEICQRSFSRKANLEYHIRIHTGERPYKCDVCQRSFSQMGDLKKHSRIHTGEKPYKCDVCQRTFRIKAILTKHIGVHSGQKPHKCDVCQRSFSEKFTLTEHIRIHTGERPYKCNVCHCSFRIRSTLRVHFRTHTGEKPYKCDVCQRSFSANGPLSKHIRMHTGEKPYMCDVCQRRFTVKGHLTRHMRIHTGEKPYTCNICQRSFNVKDHLSTHMRIHTGEKPYMCDVCQRSFRTKCHLSNHKRIHTGEKPYMCNVCQCCFSGQSTLSKHIRKHTGEKPTKPGLFPLSPYTVSPSYGDSGTSIKYLKIIPVVPVHCPRPTGTAVLQLNI